MDIRWCIAVFRVVIGALQQHLAVFQHLQQLIHLNRMQLANLIEEQNSPMRLGYCARLRLWDSGHPHGPRSLIDRIMHRADQRIGNAALVEARRSGVDLGEFGIAFEWR